MVSSSPHLQLISFLKWNFKASFSAVSHFAVLGLTQSSKVLKGIYLLFVSSMVLKEAFLVPFFSIVLKEVEVALLTSCSMFWKETSFLPDLPMVLKGVSLPLFLTVSLTVGIILFSDNSYAIYTNGLERSWLVSVLLFPALCIFGWGLERRLSACACSHGLERTGWMVLKGLRCNSLVPQWCFAIYFQAMILKGISEAGICLVFCGWNRLRNIFV